MGTLHLPSMHSSDFDTTASFPNAGWDQEPVIKGWNLTHQPEPGEHAQPIPIPQTPLVERVDGEGIRRVDHVMSDSGTIRSFQEASFMFEMDDAPHMQEALHA